MAAVAAVQAKEALRQDAACDEGVELILDELRQVAPAVSSAWAKKVAA